MKTVEEYLALPYTMVVRWSQDDNLYVARVKEISGCTGHGSNESEALAMVRENLGEWIAFCIQSGDSVPVPEESDELPSGKWLQRVPRTLHASLISCANDDEVSLNQFVMMVLAKEIGRRNGSAVIERLEASPKQTVVLHLDAWGRGEKHSPTRWNVQRPSQTQMDTAFLANLSNTSGGQDREQIKVEGRVHGVEKHSPWN